LLVISRGRNTKVNPGKQSSSPLYRSFEIRRHPPLYRIYLAIIAVNRDDRGESRSRQWCRRRARFMGLQMLTVNLRQTSGRRGEIRPDTHAVRAYNAPSRASSSCATDTRAPLTTRNSLSFRRLSHKFNNLVVRKYRPVSPVFARRSRSDCSPRAASIEHALVPLPHRCDGRKRSLRRNRCSVPFAKAAACRRNYRAGTCRDFAISSAKTVWSA
jgi:hypothetical protein